MVSNVATILCLSSVICICVPDIPHTGNKTLLEYDDTWKRLVRHYEECGYVVDPGKFPSKRAKAAARSMPQQLWPEPRSKQKGQKEEDEETEEQRIMLAAEFYQAEAAEVTENVSRPA